MGNHAVALPYLEPRMGFSWKASAGPVRRSMVHTIMVQVVQNSFSRFKSSAGLSHLPSKAGNFLALVTSRKIDSNNAFDVELSMQFTVAAARSSCFMTALTTAVFPTAASPWT